MYVTLRELGSRVVVLNSMEMLHCRLGSDAAERSSERPRIAFAMYGRQDNAKSAQRGLQVQPLASELGAEVMAGFHSLPFHDQVAEAPWSVAKWAVPRRFDDPRATVSLILLG